MGKRHFVKTSITVATCILLLSSCGLIKAIDYSRFRPTVICVETLVSGTTKTIPEIAAFMTTQGYVARGGSFVNEIFVDRNVLG